MMTRASAVLTPCSSRKSIRPALQGTAVSLPKAAQTILETAWHEHLSALEPVLRGFQASG
jgi:hypothetical protein